MRCTPAQHSAVQIPHRWAQDGSGSSRAAAAAAAAAADVSALRRDLVIAGVDGIYVAA